MKRSTIVVIFLIVVGLLVWYRMAMNTDTKGGSPTEIIQGQDGNNEEQQNNEGSNENGLLKEDQAYLFVGEGCPHCENVEKFIKENNIAERISIETLEVFVKVANQKYYKEAFKKCGEDVTQISVPVLYYKGECVEGDEPINKKLQELAA